MPNAWTIDVKLPVTSRMARFHILDPAKSITSEQTRAAADLVTALRT
jgi:hypothetical protein